MASGLSSYRVKGFRVWEFSALHRVSGLGYTGFRV